MVQQTEQKNGSAGRFDARFGCEPRTAANESQSISLGSKHQPNCSAGSGPLRTRARHGNRAESKRRRRTIDRHSLSFFCSAHLNPFATPSRPALSAVARSVAPRGCPSASSFCSHALTAIPRRRLEAFIFFASLIACFHRRLQLCTWAGGAGRLVGQAEGLHPNGNDAHTPAGDGSFPCGRSFWLMPVCVPYSHFCFVCACSFAAHISRARASPPCRTAPSARRHTDLARDTATRAVRHCLSRRSSRRSSVAQLL